MTNPKLLKARINHSRIFAGIIILVLLVSRPAFEFSAICNMGIFCLGYVLVIIGAFGRVYCSAFIGGRKNDEVIRSGPFSIVRNPLYVFSFIAMVGVGLQSQMLLLTAVLIVIFVLYYPLVVAKEEAFLENKFGEPYLKYKAEVPRWIPNFKLWNEPEQVDAKPKFIRKTMLDASVFFLAMPAFLIINALHSSQILPVWLTLP